MVENGSNLFSPEGFRLAFVLPDFPEGYRVVARTNLKNRIGIIYLIDRESCVAGQILITLGVFRSDGGEQNALWFKVNSDNGKIDNPGGHQIKELSPERFFILQAFAAPVSPDGENKELSKPTNVKQIKPAKTPR